MDVDPMISLFISSIYNLAPLLMGKNFFTIKFLVAMKDSQFFLVLYDKMEMQNSKAL